MTGADTHHTIYKISLTQRPPRLASLAARFARRTLRSPHASLAAETDHAYGEDMSKDGLLFVRDKLIWDPRKFWTHEKVSPPLPS